MGKRKEIVTNIAILIIVYSILLALTALPLLFNMMTQNYGGCLLGRILTYVLMFGVVFGFCKNKKKVFSDFGGLSRKVCKFFKS